MAKQSRGGGDTSANAAGKNGRWWKERGTKAGEMMAAHVDELQNLTVGRVRQFNSNVETYGAPERGAFGAYGGSREGYRSGRTGGINKQQLALPAAWSVIQALASEMLSNEPAPQFMVSGGDYKARKNSELLTNLTNGVAYQVSYNEIRAEMFIDACVGGTGWMYADLTADGKIVAERVFPPEMVSDPNDDIYGTPRCRFRVKFIDRDVLREMFPKANMERLETAKTLSGLLTTGNARQNSMVKVYWGWHLPSGPSAKDGRAIVCTNNDVLFEADYKRQQFPIIRFRYDKRLMGDLGVGICELIGSLQNHANELLLATQQSMQRHGVPHWLVPTNSFVNKQELNDLIGSIIYYSGTTPPELVAWKSMPEDVMEQIQFDLDQIYKMTGVSLMAASAMKPAGLDSGEAIRAYVDTNSARFQNLGKKLERLDSESFDWFALLAREAAEKLQSYPVRVVKKWSGGHSLDVLDWKSAKEIREEDWEIECFPISALPKTPAGKLQYVKDLAEIPGVLGSLDIVELLEMPDTTAELRLKLAGIKLAQQLVSDIIDEGIYRAPPQDCMPLEWTLAHVSQVLAQGEREKAPPKRLEMLRAWQAQIVDQMQAANPPQPDQTAPIVPPPGAGAGAPPAPGAPSPMAMIQPAPQAPLAPVAQPGQ